MANKCGTNLPTAPNMNPAIISQTECIESANSCACCAASGAGILAKTLTCLP